MSEKPFRPLPDPMLLLLALQTFIVSFAFCRYYKRPTTFYKIQLQLYLQVTFEKQLEILSNIYYQTVLYFIGSYLTKQYA